MGMKLSGTFQFVFRNDFDGFMSAERRYEVFAVNLTDARDQCREKALSDMTLPRMNAVRCCHIAYLDGRVWRKVMMRDLDTDAGTCVESLF